MKIYAHNYSLPAAAEVKLYEAYKLSQEPDVQKLIAEARDMLSKYLSSDNLVEDEDCEGVIKRSEAEAEIEKLKSQLSSLHKK